MGLIDLKTDLKSLKYGKDTFGGGNSKQPFVKEPIPDQYEGKNSSIDFLFRSGGNTSLLKEYQNDLTRITKFLSTTQGTLFIIKQEALAKQDVPRAGGVIKDNPTRLYNPLTTLAQLNLGQFGAHFDGKGINPNLQTPDKYFTIYKNTSLEDNLLIKLSGSALQKTEDTFLLKYKNGPGVPLFSNTIINFADQRTGTNNPLSISQPGFFYSGSSLHTKNYDINYNKMLGASVKDGVADSSQTGFNQQGQQFKLFGPLDDNSTISKNPGKYTLIESSQYGQGKKEHTYEKPNFTGSLGLSNLPYTGSTTIPNNQKGVAADGVTTGLFGASASPKSVAGRTVPIPSSLTGSKQFSINKSLGASSVYNKLTNTRINNNFLNFIPSVYTPSSAGTFPTQTTSVNFYPINGNINSNKSTVFVQKDLINFIPFQDNSVFDLKDFRKKVINSLSGIKTTPTNTVLSSSPDYNLKSREVRLKLGDPGKRKNRNVISYHNGLGKALDQINARPIVAGNPRSPVLLEDMVNFAICPIDNNNPASGQIIQFRAFLDNFGDNFNSKWSSIQYLGRGEEFYNYGGFSRKISLGWTIVAQSKEELQPMFQKLNTLCSNLLPDYNTNGYMRGPLVTLTVGSYVKGLVGFIESINLELVSDNTTWEIGIDDKGNQTGVQLPHMIKVTGVSFTPIHSFLPRKYGTDNPLTQNNALMAASTI